jgi:hypothetical protein
MTLDETGRQPLPVTLDGRPYLVQPRSLAELAPLQAWFRREVPSPLARVLAALAQCQRHEVLIEPVVRDLLLAQARRDESRWPPRPGTAVWMQAVDDADLAGRVLHFALAPCQPDLTEPDCDDLVAAASVAEIAVLCCALFIGKLPDPKAPTAATTTTQPTTPTTTSPTTSPTTATTGT